MEHYGDYNEIERDFFAGKLEPQWRAYLDGLRRDRAERAARPHTFRRLK
jgi:hypothetical protein